MDKAEKLQIQPAQRGLQFANVRLIARRMGEFAGDFLGGIYSPRTQVDIAAHCVSAMVKIRRNALLQ